MAKTDSVSKTITRKIALMKPIKPVEQFALDVVLFIFPLDGDRAAHQNSKYYTFEIFMHLGSRT